MDCEGLWQEMTCLIGITLKTLEHKRPFVIRKVQETCLVIQPLSSSRTYSIPRDALVETFTRLKDKIELSSKEVARVAGEQHASYLVTLLASMPDIAVSHKPTKLIYYGSQSFYLPIQKN